MKNILKHIVIAAVIIISAACSREEFIPVHKGQNVEFILRQTGFTGFDVAANETKVLTNEQLTELETSIHSLYFMVFDASGNRREFKSLATNITSQTLYHNYGNGPLTVCYLANVPQAYAESIDHIDDFANVPLDGISYTYDKTSAGDFVVIPQIGGVQCIPMFGKVAYPGAAVNESIVEIPLERLFAKVVVSLKADLSDANWGISLDPPSIELESFSVVNLPEKVALQEALATDGTIIRESAWTRTSDAFADPVGTVFDPRLNVSDDRINLGGTSLAGFTKVISCYIPEYTLAPSASNTANDQKRKPDFCPSDKYPVFLTFRGVAKQDKMVDVPLEYFIHFGENPYDSFSLRRNTQYENEITIKGTLEAVLETDKRVDATYHNLADPLNTGSDNPANCYIISKPGRYLIPTYVGNDVNQPLSGKSAESLTINGSANNRVDNIKCLTINGKNFIQFDVNMFDDAGNTTLTDVAGGNKLLVLKNESGQIIWSWHLWLCEDGNRPDNEGYLNTYPTSGSVVMNRALGALNHQGIESLGYSIAYWHDGLYYQWGRKDPMLASGNTINSNVTTHLVSVENPTTFFTKWAGTYNNETNAIGWTAEKSINDPCPPGYKVPLKSIWRTENASDGLESVISSLGISGYPYNLQTSGGLQKNIVYPYSGHLESDTGDMFATDILTTEYKSPEGEVYSLGITVLTWEVASDRVKDLVLEIELNSEMGRLWSISQDSPKNHWAAFTFEHGFLEITPGNISSIADKITIKSCKICHNNYEIKYRTLPSSLGGGKIPTGITDHWEDSYTDFPNGPGDRLTDTDKAILFGKLFTQTTAFNKLSSAFDDELETAHGAYVRCVRE